MNRTRLISEAKRLLRAFIDKDLPGIVAGDEEEPEEDYAWRVRDQLEEATEELISDLEHLLRESR